MFPVSQVTMSYTVKEIPLVWIPVADGLRLAATMWLPSKKDDSPESMETFPAILGKSGFVVLFKFI